MQNGNAPASQETSSQGNEYFVFYQGPEGRDPPLDAHTMAYGTPRYVLDHFFYKMRSVLRELQDTRGPAPGHRFLFTLRRESDGWLKRDCDVHEAILWLESQC